jgi:tetratricopeptide (TPR) repeat protein
MACLSESTIALLLEENGLPPDALRDVQLHLDACEKCRELVAEAARSAVGATVGDETSLQRAGPPAAAAPTRGTNLERYVVLGTLGAGGMGVVVAAYDPELDRKVAIKLLRADGPGTGRESARGRMLREAQAMARLSHPNVITVHDVGTFEDQVFVAMELVEGMTLTTWLRAEPRPWREVVRTFLQAGRGLAAAHSAGLVHRDFKPDNVLVGADGRVRVTDFGLARPFAPLFGEVPGPAATPLQVSTATVAGTPAYMAPEQIRGEPIDARADLFSFCVALYEALYGARPFPGDTLEDLRDAILSGRLREPPPRTRVPGRLRSVLARGLRARPEERYPSMEPLLAELGRDPAVLRGRLAAAIAAVGVALFVLQSAREESALCRGAERKLAGVWDEGRKHEAGRALRATGKPYAAQVQATLVRLLDEYARAWTETHTEACEATRVRGDQSETLLDLRMQCLGRRLEGLRALVDELTRADGSAAERAVRAVQGLEPPATCSAAEALRAGAGPPLGPGERAAVEAFERKLAELEALYALGRAREALPKVVVLGASVRARGHRPTEARLLFLRGELEQELGRFAASEKTIHEAMGLALASKDDLLAARSASRLVNVVGHKLAKYDEAHRWDRLARALLERAGGDGRLQARLEARLSTVLFEEGRYEEAGAHAERSLALARGLFGPEHLSVADSHRALASALSARGRNEEAWTHARLVLELREKALGADHPHVAAALIVLGNIVDDLGRREEALGHFGRALRIVERVFGPEHPQASAARNNLGSVLYRLGRLEEAREQFERSLAIKEKALGPEHPASASTLRNLGLVLLDRGEYARARSFLERALARRERLGPDHAQFARTLADLGELALREGRTAEARVQLQRAHDILAKNLGPSHADLLGPLVGIARVFLREGTPLRTLSLLEKALPVAERGKPDALTLALGRFALARALRKVGRDPARARSLAEKARRAMEKLGGAQRRWLAQVEAWLRER